MTSIEDEQRLNNDSPLKEVAMVATIGAVLGAAIGAATASRKAKSDEADESVEQEEPQEVEAKAEAAEVSADGDEGEREEEEEEVAQEPEAESSQEPEPEPAAQDVDEPEAEEPEEPEEVEDVEEAEPPAGLEVVRSVEKQLEVLTGRTVEGALGMERNGDGGWSITVEVVELPRVPSSTDVLAAYEVLVDGGGEIREWRRTGRYVRSGAGEGQS